MALFGFGKKPTRSDLESRLQKANAELQKKADRYSKARAQKLPPVSKDNLRRMSEELEAAKMNRDLAREALEDYQGED